MPVAGAVADRARGILPITWDALSRNPVYGDDSLQRIVNLAKESATGIVIDTALEDTYPLVAVDYMAKLVAIEIAQAGIDFWMNQSQTISSSGTNESLSYVDRASVLASLRNDLILETRQKYTQVAKLLGYYVDNGRAVPQLSSATINPYHLTPSPEEFPRPYKQTQYS